MDYSFCEALKQILGIPQIALFYDIMCQWWINFSKCAEAASEFLEFDTDLKVQTGIGTFHIHSHQNQCYSQYFSFFLEGIELVNREVIETL